MTLITTIAATALVTLTTFMVACASASRQPRPRLAKIHHHCHWVAYAMYYGHSAFGDVGAHAVLGGVLLVLLFVGALIGTDEV
jgi:hypothetical protein